METSSVAVLGRIGVRKNTRTYSCRDSISSSPGTVAAGTDKVVEEAQTEAAEDGDHAMPEEAVDAVGVVNAVVAETPATGEC